MAAFFVMMEGFILQNRATGMLKLSSLLVIISLIASNSGCSVLGKKVDQDNGAYQDPNTSGVEAQLAETAQAIEKSLHTLAAAQEVTSPPILNTGPLVTPEGGMGGTADIDWTGPIAPLLSKIAEMTDYRLKTLGNEPAIPVIVTITAKNAIVAEILQNASLQAGNKAQVMVYPSTRVIELRYQAP